MLRPPRSLASLISGQRVRTSARTASAESRSSAAWAADWQARLSSVRTTALIRGAAEGVTESFDTPRPISSGAATGSDASPPHTATGVDRA